MSEILTPRLTNGCEKNRYPHDTEYKRLLKGEYQYSKVLIPKYYLFGIQEQEEYSSIKREKFKLNSIDNENNFLLNNPILTTTLFFNDCAQIIILDGHHRARYAKTKTIPSFLLDVNEAAKLYQKTLVDFELYISHGVVEALKSFSSMPNEKQPKLFPKIQNMNELISKFASF